MIGKSLLANGTPKLKFIVLTKPDFGSLNGVLGNGDEKILQSAMKNDMYVSVDSNDTFKKKNFITTYDTIRTQYADIINKEIANYEAHKTELMTRALDESFRKVPVQKIQIELEKNRAVQQSINNFGNQIFRAQ